MSGQTPRPPAGKQVWTNGSGEMRSPSSGQPPTCPTKTPEEHYLGEFPLTCFACHMHADA